MRVTVLPTPGAGPVDPDQTAVVIDVLRATTTLTCALDRGATRVIPAATPEEAKRIRQSEPSALLCGERGGRRIDGFDLGNSPFEYAPERVADRTLIFASTNGSRAMLHARPARRRLLGAFLNAAAAVDAAASATAVVLICSGKLGRFALEDMACAGWIARGLMSRGGRAEGPAARLALHLAPRDASEIEGLVTGCAHARELRALGPEYVKDLAFCARLDALSRVFEI